MSRRADPSAQKQRDSGFTLIEVMVAIGMLGVLVAALLPQLVVGIRSNDVARASSQSKGFAQAELERIRNLPFHISRAAGEFVDVFDRYYPNTTAGTAPQCGTAGARKTPLTDWTGYVDTASSARCWWEPPTGAFYRYVRTETTNPELKGFVVVVDTQFLTVTSPPVPQPPRAGYNHNDGTNDRPPAQTQAGVTVAVFQVDKPTREPFVTFTQIDPRDPPVTRTSSALDITAVDLGTANTAAQPVPVTLSAGLVKLASSLTYSSTASAVLSSASTGAATGQQAGGAGVTVTAPPNASASLDDESGGHLDSSGCALACWGDTRHSAASVSAGNALPNAGSPAAPLQSIVRNSSGVGLSLGAGATPGYRPELQLDPQGLVTQLTGTPAGSSIASTVNSGVSSSCAGTSAGDSVRTASSGWLRTTASDAAPNPLMVESCGVARTAPISVLPTTFAPYGVLRISLQDASVRCAVSGAAHTATAQASYTATVERWTPAGYVALPQITASNTTDPLAAVPLTTPVGPDHTLGDYIATWSSLTSDKVVKSTAPGSASVSLPGVLSLTTRPTRPGTAPDGTEPLSTVSVSVGVMSCSAKDAR